MDNEVKRFLEEISKVCKEFDMRINILPEYFGTTVGVSVISNNASEGVCVSDGARVAIIGKNGIITE